MKRFFLIALCAPVLSQAMTIKESEKVFATAVIFHCQKLQNNAEEGDIDSARALHEFCKAAHGDGIITDKNAIEKLSTSPLITRKSKSIQRDNITYDAFAVIPEDIKRAMQEICMQKEIDKQRVHDMTSKEII